eukprot:scaffold210414_cov23-Cyclotella_meneghiniana.AAC.2
MHRRYEILNGFDFGIGKGSADETFDGVECVFGIGHGLTFGGHADETGVVGDGYYGGCGACSLGVFDDSCISSFLIDMT